MIHKYNQILAYINGNLGDDLFIKILCERYPKQKFVLCGPKMYKDNFGYLNNLKYVPTDTLFLKLLYKMVSIIRKVFKKPLVYRDKLLINIISKHVNVNILITGSYFVETPYRLEEAKMELPFYKSNSYILNCNFGPYKTQEFYLQFAKYFSMTKWISFRDRASFNLFKDLSNVHYGPDVACGVKIQDKEVKDYVVISVMDFSYIMDGLWAEIATHYLNRIEEIIKYHTAQRKRVYLISFCESLGDLSVANELKKRTNNDNVKVWDYNQNKMNASIQMIANSEIVYASRFHALILGLIFGKKVVPFCYSNKMDNILEDLGYDKSIYRIDNMIHKQIYEYNDICIQLSENQINKLSKASEKHFESLDKIFND